MLSFSFELDSSKKLDVALFHNVKNSSQLLDAAVSGAIQAAFVNASLVHSLLPVKVAAWKAISDQALGTMMTKNVHTELVFNLSPDNAIATSLKTFGISEKTSSVLLCLVNATPEQRDKAFKMIVGDAVPNVDSALTKECDINTIRELYKINKVEEQANGIVNAIINRISCKVSKKLGLAE